MSRKVAIITGAGGDIGIATATLLARSGHDIVALDMYDDALDRVEQALKGGGARLLRIVASVADPDHVKDAVDRTVAEFGGIDVLVNNAGIEGVVRNIIDYPINVFDEVLSINVRGTMLTMQHVIPFMIARKSGSIVNASSVAGIRGRPGLSAYVASKHAVVGLTRTAAIETAPYGVRVNCISPGPIAGRMIQAIDASRRTIPDLGSGTPAPKVPAGRYGQPEEVAALIAFLASDESHFINGSVLPVDGAMTAM